MKRPSIATILLVILGLLALGMVVCLSSTIIACGKPPFQLIVVENGRPLSPDQIKSVQYLSLDELSEADALAAELSEAGKEGTELIWDPRPGLSEENSWYVRVPVSTTKYCFVHQRTRWRRAGVVGIELVDGRREFRAYEVPSLDGDRKIVVNIRP